MPSSNFNTSIASATIQTMTRRYYLPDLPHQGGKISLSGPEFQHAARVMRVQIDDEIQLFDGHGNQAAARITQIGRRDLQAFADASTLVDREPTRSIHLGVALPKPDRARELIERLTELGVKRVTPIIAARTQRGPSASLIEKLRRAVIESSKQCERNVLMTINDPSEFVNFLSSEPSGERWIAHPGGTSLATVAESADTITALIGPEGGWTDAEIEAAKSANYQVIGFGKRIYRVETAAVYLASRLIDE